MPIIEIWVWKFEFERPKIFNIELTLFEGSLAWMPEIESVPRRPMARTPNKSIIPKKTWIAVIATNFLLSEEDRILLEKLMREDDEPGDNTQKYEM